MRMRFGGLSNERYRRRKKQEEAEEAKVARSNGRKSCDGRIVETRIRGAAIGSHGPCPARSGRRLCAKVHSSQDRALPAVVRAPCKLCQEPGGSSDGVRPFGTRTRYLVCSFLC